MKKIQPAIILLLFMGLVSCKKTENKSTASNPPTGDEVAAIVANALAVNSHGLAANFNEIVANAPISVNQGCGTTVSDSTISSGNANGVTYNYFLKYTHFLVCNHNGLQDNITYNLTYHGSSVGPSVNSLDTGTSVFKIAGFTPTATVYQINGEYKRTGKFTVTQQTFINEASGYSNVDVVATNCQISKSTNMVVSGSATVTIFIAVGGTMFEFYAPASFTYGTLTLTNIYGRNYTIDLYTGLVSNQ